MADPAKLLFVSAFGGTADLAQRALSEGSEVRFWVQSRAEKEVGDGFVPKVDDWKAHVDWADV
ncbi:MAG TPA: phosphoribosylamine--glycine ligase, partial [Planctomycetota bacterium]|nr:phosphoribosylamine--glycine ligase [Planctomycetota bacterium]